MQVFHSSWTVVAAFDGPNLMSAASLLPMMSLAERSGVRNLVDRWLSVSTDNRANVGKKVSSLVGGMVAGLTRSAYANQLSMPISAGSRWNHSFVN